MQPAHYLLCALHFSLLSTFFQKRNGYGRLHAIFIISNRLYNWFKIRNSQPATQSFYFKLRYVHILQPVVFTFIYMENQCDNKYWPSLVWIFLLPLWASDFEWTMQNNDEILHTLFSKLYFDTRVLFII